MLTIGCHLSTTNGYAAMGRNAISIGANTFQFFTRNPRGSRAKDIDLSDANTLAEIMKAHQFGPILAHAPYTLNPCSKDPMIRDIAKQMMQDDLQRLRLLPCTLYNFHPGSHTGQGAAIGISQIATVLNSLLTPEQSCTVLLETMSGKGSEVGSTFEELRDILSAVELTSKVGVCLDICHVHDAGYDIVHDLDGVLSHFDRLVGLEKLYAIHCNDSLNPCGSHKDRHAKIGEGTIGLDAIGRIVTHPDLRHLPFFLETPNELSGYAAEITLLRDIHAK